MASLSITLLGRYQISGRPIGEGGMGVVYKAYDTVTKRPVALKTMRGPQNAAALELFAKEWTLLAQISHPNIVDVLDTGEFAENGEPKPFFVMPFLPGATLEELLRNATPRLTPERIVGIIGQACRGLQAAHDHGLIHRDLKPSNIFVLDDDAVKLIDFGLVHLAGTDSTKALKGTLQYMAPEQIDLKPCTPASDIFSLAIVTYEAFTGRRPFARETEIETARAIRSHIPPPICELNPSVSQIVSRVVHKAMAKDPWHRFSTAREFSDALQRALKNQPIERFENSRIQPRIDRAKKAYGEGDYQFASEILRELEAEGNIDPEMSVLRIQIDHVMRQKSIRQLLDNVQTRLEEEEFPLALQKIQEVLALDPDNPEAAGLRSQIEKRMSRRQTENWFRLVDQHLHNRSFGQARQALQEILKLNANDTKARELLGEIDSREQEIERLRAEKEQLYQAALSLYQRGEISSALTKLERILEVTRRSPDSAIPERDAHYQSLYNQVCNEQEAFRNAYAEARRYLADRNFGKALEMCNEFLKKSPGEPMFQALKLEVEEQSRQEQSAFIAEVTRRVEAESDLDRRVNILQEAVDRYPQEPHLEQSLRLVRERRDLVNSIMAKARLYEDNAQFTDALSQIEILRNIYAQYPGIEFEAERLKRRREEQVCGEAKSRWVEQIDRHIASGDYDRARDLLRSAMAEFPEDRELAGLERFAETALKRGAEAKQWLERGQKLCSDRQFAEGLEALQKAASLDSRNAQIRSSLFNALTEQARSVLGQDWRAAEPLIEQALSIDGGHPLAKSLQGLILDYKRQESVNECVSQARELQAEGDLSGALAQVDAGLAVYPNESRLLQLSATLQKLGAVPAPAPKQAAPAPVPAPPVQNQAAGSLSEVPLPPAPDPSRATEFFTLDRTIPEPAKVPVSQGASAPRRAVGPADVMRARWIKLKDSAAGRLVLLRQGLPDLAGRKAKAQSAQWSIVILASSILVAGLVVTLIHHRTPPHKAAPADYLVDLQSNVLNAKFVVDRQAATALPLRLKEGAHTVEASAVGYKPATKSFTLAAGVSRPYPVSLVLEPEPIRVRLFSDLKAGKVTFDGQESDLSDGAFINEAVSLSTSHTLSLSQSGKESLSVGFGGDPGRLVTLSGPIVTKDLKTVLISDLGSHARVYSSDPSLKGGMKDQTPQPIPTEGLELNVTDGNTEFMLDDGKSPQPVPFELSNAPALTIWIASDPDLGRLQIEANVPDADLFIDGRKRRPLRPGKNDYSLEPGTHTIRVAKEGYEGPPEQKVDLKKGDRIEVPRFDLRLMPTTALVVIEGATPDAEVLVDGLHEGTIGADGSFRIGALNPGNHAFILRKDNFEPKQFARSFTAGQTVTIAGSDAQLTPFGALDFRVSPPSAGLTYQRLEEPQPHAVQNGRTVPLRAGRYLIRASADGYTARQDTIEVQPGKTQSIDWMLAMIVEPKKAPSAPAPPITLTKNDFADPDSWRLEGAELVHRGDNVSWLKSNQGIYLIRILRQKANRVFVKTTRRVEWITDQKDSGDHVDYRFDFGSPGSLERQATPGGKGETKRKVQVSDASGESYMLRIEISPESIVVKDESGRELDRYHRPNPSEHLGKFGFKGDVALVIQRVE
jgi:eukaryotic-like serine/threonine-protein kinase